MRCFLALEINEETREKLAETIRKARQTGINVSFVKPEQLHVTLLFLGEKNESEIGRIQEKLQESKFPRFRLYVKGAGFFPNEQRINVFWTGAGDEQNKLQQLYERTCQLLNEKAEKHFVGHITLARVKGKENLEELRGFKQSLENEVFGEFEVEKVVLKKSTLTPAGAVYEDLNSFPLL